jgi:hypothetical protein
MATMIKISGSPILNITPPAKFYTIIFLSFAMGEAVQRRGFVVRKKVRRQRPFEK